MKNLLRCIACVICLGIVSCESIEKNTILEDLDEINQLTLFISNVRDIEDDSIVVNVEMDGKPIGSFTDQFYIRKLNKGNHVFKISTKGYKPLEKKIYIIGYPQEQYLGFILERE